MVGRRHRHGVAMTSDAILSCENLSASYDGRDILCSVTFSLGAGLYALRGANGIGKSTLLRLLAGAQTPDAGRVLIDGVDMKKSSEKARGRLAYVPDECPVYPFMTGDEFLRFVASTKRVKFDDSANEFIAAFGLHEHLDARFDEMSLGTKKKMMLCACWIGAPKALLLDEPSNGLDLASREYLIQRLQQAAREKMILFSAHDADFVSDSGAVTIEMTALVGSTHLARTDRC
jgi:ABC-2 type transport system ATP-binding protein